MKSKLGRIALLALVCGMMASCPSPVSNDPVVPSVDLELTPLSGSVQSGDGLDLVASWTPSSVATRIQWTSGDADVAVFTSSGTGAANTAVGSFPGSTTLTAATMDATADPMEATLEVTPRTLAPGGVWTQHTSRAVAPIIYQLDLKADTTYEVQWREKGYSYLTGNISVGMLAADLETVLKPEQDVCTSSTSPMEYTPPADETVYVIVRPTAGYLGSYQLWCANMTPPDSLALSADLTTVESGKYATLTVTPTPEGTSEIVTYTSSASDILSVSEGGKAYALTAGTATITATSTANPSKTAAITINVIEQPLPFDTWVDGTFVDGIHLITKKVWYSFPVDSSRIYAVSWNDKDSGDGTKTARLRVYCYRENKFSTYFSYIEDAYGPDAQIIKPYGSETLYLQCSPLEVGSYSVHLQEYQPSSAVDILQSNLNINSGESVQLTSSVLPTSAYQVVSWSTSDYRVATVAEDGTVIGKKPGTVTITAKSKSDSSIMDTCQISVSPVPLVDGAWVNVNMTESFETWYSIPSTNGKCYEVIAEDSDSSGAYFADIAISAYQEDLTTMYFSQYSRMDGDHSRFVIPASGAGYIILQARPFLEETGEARFCVREHDAPESITITGVSTLTNPGTTQLSAVVIPASAPQRMTWSVSGSPMGSVDSQGLATASAYGQFTVHVQSDANNLLVDEVTITVTEPAKASAWTVMYYSDADCNLEAALMDDIAEMKAGLQVGANINIILLVDRNPNISYPYSNESTTLGENFADARLYRILPDSYMRLDGSTQFPEIGDLGSYEANMGDANTLGKFIDFCKANYPADNYALFVSNHGNGVRSPNDEIIKSSVKAVCFDESSGNDSLYTAELTDVLTADHSVDLFAFDACLMSAIEIAYQYRPGTGDFSADYMLASAPTVWGAGFPYTEIFQRIRAGGGNNGTADTVVGGSELYHDPVAMTAIQFGAVIVEEQRDSTVAEPSYGGGQSLTLVDLAAAGQVKTSLDQLAVLLSTEGEKTDVETLRGSYSSTGVMEYFGAATAEEWIANPHFDIYDLAYKIGASANFSAGVQAKAAELYGYVDTAILYSFGNSSYTGFLPGKHGLSVFFPDGDRLYTPSGGSAAPMWAFQWWYSPIDTNALQPGLLYGKMAFCADGRVPVASTVENWFELMDSWFDKPGNNPADDYNGVQW